MAETIKSIAKKSIRVVLFLSIGVFLFWYVYKDIEMGQIKASLPQFNYGIIVFSFIFTLASHYFRALKWRMLLDPIKPGTKVSTLLSAILIVYFANLFVPRLGEFSRCVVVSKKENIPLSKIIGTVVTERAIDIFILIIILIVALLTQFPVIMKFLDTYPVVKSNIDKLASVRNILLLSVSGVIFIAMLIILRKKLFHLTIIQKIWATGKNVLEGAISIFKLKKSWLFIIWSICIWIMYYIMYHICFFSWEPVAALSFSAIFTSFIMGSLGMVAPVQGGIGAWHFMVIGTLVIYGLPNEEAKIYALVAHGASTLFMFFSGLMALLWLWLSKSK